jgi:hypothetical protein
MSTDLEFYKKELERLLKEKARLIKHVDRLRNGVWDESDFAWKRKFYKKEVTNESR